MLVNFTSLSENCVDDACILGPGDFVLLSHATTVAYSRALAGPVATVETLIQKGGFTVVTPVPAATLRKVLEGAQASRELSAANKALAG